MDIALRGRIRRLHSAGLRWFLAITVFSALDSAGAVEARFFLGTYTNDRTSKGIYTCTIDLESGRLGPIELAARTDNPSYLAISPNGKCLYAAGEAHPHGLTTAYRVEDAGNLTFLNQVDSGGEGTCHVCVDAGGRHVFVANYDGGSIACFQTGPDGRLGARTALVQFTGPDSDPGRKSHPHSVYTTPSNRFLYSCDLGTDHIWIFNFDAGNGALERSSPASARAPNGGGPRHLAFHPTGRYVFVNNEMGRSVSVFACDAASGALTPLQVIPTLQEGTAGTRTAEIACHPSGKWLYVSNRGDDTIATFTIGADGRLTWIGNIPARVKVPRGFAIDPTGHWLIAAGQDDNKMAVLKINQATGELSFTDQVASIGSPVCVLFAPAK